MNRRLIAAILLAAAPALVSCRKKPRPKPLPARIPVQTESARPAPPPLLDVPPEIAVQEPQLAIVEQAGAPVLPPPPAAKKRAPQPGPRATVPEPPAIQPAPQLRPLLTPAQTRELERMIGERLRRAQAVLGSVRGRSLTGELADLAAQIRTFILQAEEARETDLLRANNLAERAEVLAQDLAQRLR